MIIALYKLNLSLSRFTYHFTYRFIYHFTSLLLALFVVMLSPVAIAKEKKNLESNLSIYDYGTRGQTFSIAELSLLEEIMEKLELAEENGTLKKMQTEFSDKVKAKVLRPTPVANLHKATTNRSWTYNPIFTQETDIIDDKGRVIIAAGTNVNALEKLKWGEPLIFIDGEDKEQVEWAKNQQGKIVLTNGAPLELGNRLKRPIYFDQGGILCRRFNIEFVPAFIEQDGLLLKVSEVKL
jgi:conjugal transfer pilus assembly protein TraW